MDPRNITEKPGRLHEPAYLSGDSEALRDDAKEHWHKSRNLTARGRVTIKHEARRRYLAFGYDEAVLLKRVLAVRQTKQ